MSTPPPIGPVHFSEPRAVKVREPENISEIHSAVHGNVAIYVDSVEEAHAILGAWRVIMQKAADEAQLVLDEYRRFQIDDVTMNRYRGDTTEQMKTGM